MKIVDFSDTYLPQMASIFVTEYSEPERKWNVETAIAYLRKNIVSNPEYCKVAVTDTDEFMGGICCRIDPYYSGSLLFIDSLEVDRQYRHHGVGTELLKNVVATAKQNGVDQIHFLGDSRKGFPKAWYQELGFIETGWVEYEMSTDKLQFKK